MSRLAFAVLSVVIGVALGFGSVAVLDTVDVRQLTIGPSATTDDPTSAPSPPAADPTPVRVTIPDIDIDVELVGIGLNDDRSMEVPEFGQAGWYELGPRPGEPGPAVISAHVSSQDGPDVFHRLTDLERGAEITVEHADGSASTFVMRSAEQHRKEQLPVRRIWGASPDSVLRLITCGGAYDEDDDSYRSNVIVYAAVAG